MKRKLHTKISKYKFLGVGKCTQEHSRVGVGAGRPSGRVSLYPVRALQSCSVYLGKLLPGSSWLLSMMFVRQTQRGHAFDGHLTPSSSAARGRAPSQGTSQASATHCVACATGTQSVNLSKRGKWELNIYFKRNYSVKSF